MIADLDKLLAINGTVNIGNELIMLSDMSQLPIPDEPSRAEHIIVALCLKGSATFTVDAKERYLNAGDLIIIQRDRVIANLRCSEGSNGIAMIWSKEYFDDMVKDIKELGNLFLFSRMRAVISLSEKEVNNVKCLFSLIEEKVKDEGNHFRNEIVQTLIMSLIYEVSNSIHRSQASLMAGSNKRSHDIFVRFITLVEENYRAERRVGWYAEQLNITSKYLSETVKQVSGRTPNEWIDNYVVREIRVQLRNSSKSIKEIAEGLNFPSQSFLGKFFKERIGMSPKEYRMK
ncbi:MAG: AraC family transcriptional regulator [Bacteroidaceae bacterium]|nr:AraC family transcriptional regulator [Bacteroidaceae bacterium]